MSALQQPSQTSVPNPFTLEYVGKDISAGMNIQNRGAVPAGDSVYMIPYAANEVVQHNVNNNSQVKFSVKKMRGAYHRKNKYVGGVLAPNGKIYSGAHGAHTPLIIDTNTTPPTLSEVSGNGSYSMQARGPVYNNDRVYIPSYTGGKLWRVVDTTTDSRVPNINWAPIPRTDRIYQIRPFHEEESGMFYDTNFGAVNGGNDKMYGMPHGASRINILDTTNNKTSWGEDSITGNAPMSDVPRTSKMLLYATCFNKYRSGALANNGCIYAHGYMARSILKIDTRDDSAIEIPYPKAIIDEMCDNKPESHLTPKAASFSSVLGSDGKVYSVPWGIPYILWIDPVDDSIGFKDISSTLDESGSIRFDNSGDVRNNGGWYTYATAVGDSIYYSPAAADKVLKLTINNAGNPSNIPSHTVISNASSPSATPSIVSCNTSSPSAGACNTSSPSPASPSKIKHDNLNIEQEDNTALIGVGIAQQWIFGNDRKIAPQKRNLKCVWNSFKGRTAVPACALDGSDYNYSSEWNSYNGVALTKRHILFCQHWGGWDAHRPRGGTSNGKFLFVGPNNEQHWAIVAYDKPWGARIGHTDLRVVQLSEDLPDWVEMGILASDEQIQYIANRYTSTSKRIPLLCSPANRNRTLRITDGKLTAGNVSRWSGKRENVILPFKSKRASYYYDLAFGDSGTVQHILIDGQLIVVGNTTTGREGSGNTVMKHHSAIQTAIDDMNKVHGLSGYQIQISDVSIEAIEHQLSKGDDYVTKMHIDVPPPALVEPTVIASPATCNTYTCASPANSHSVTPSISHCMPPTTICNTPSPAAVTCNTSSPSIVSCNITCAVSCASPTITSCITSSCPSPSTCRVTCSEEITPVIIPTSSPSQPKSSNCYVGSSCCTQSCRISFAGIWSRLVCDIQRSFCKK